MSDAMSSYMKIAQGKESEVQYLVRAKTSLERIYHILKLSNMNSGGLNHLPLVQSVKDLCIRWRVAKEAENWKRVEDAFNSISKNAREAEKTKAYHKPRYEDITTISEIHNQQRVSNEYSKCMFREYNWPKTVKQMAIKTNQTLECYCCNEPH